MKKIISLLLSALIAIYSPVCLAQNTDTSVGSTVEESDNFGIKLSLNGETRNLVAYNIKNNNYFKLRDIANLLKGTEAQFDVIWNEGKNAIELLSFTPYSTNEALTSETLKNPVATSSYVPIYKDGATVLLGAYNIAGNNYFKLRDVASVIDFGVDWNADEGIIEINTSEGYEYPTSTEFGLNTQYLSFIGKTKSEIDSILGIGRYSGEWGMSTYGGNVMVGWNSLGESPAETSRVVSMYIPLEKLFFNCPQSLTKDGIKSLFPSSREEYNAMDEETTLMVNYCGKVLAFYPDYGLTSSATAFINIMTDYVNPDAEIIQINNYTEPASPVTENNNDYFEGSYQTDEWVSGSYIEVTKSGSEYVVNLLLVRGASIENETAKIDGNKLVLNENFENLVIEWSEDRNSLTVQCSDRNWQYMVTDEPIPFYRTK